jgi:hypothetical protein
MPLNMQQVLALAGGATEATSALMSGHPLGAVAGAVPIAVTAASKIRNAPANLIKTALSQTSEQLAPSATKATAKELAPKAAAMAGSQAAQTMQGWIKFVGKDGQTYQIHPDDLQKAQDRGLVDKVIQ